MMRDRDSLRTFLFAASDFEASPCLNSCQFVRTNRTVRMRFAFCDAFQIGLRGMAIGNPENLIQSEEKCRSEKYNDHSNSGELQKINYRIRAGVSTEMRDSCFTPHCHTLLR